MDRVMVFLIKDHPKVLERVGENLKMTTLTANKRINPYIATAMWNEADITLRGQRVIKKYIHSVFGFQITPAQHHINATSDHYTKPIHEESEVGETTIT